MTTRLYLIRATESQRLKIGIATDPLKRLGTLQTGCPERLELVRTIDYPDRATARRAEKALHTRFDLFHIHGEWFQNRTLITDWFNGIKTERDRLKGAAK